MSISRINQIKRIVKDHPVTDPRGAMLAIEQVLAQKEPKGAKPVAVIKVFDNPESSGPLKATVKIEYSGKRLEPRHMVAVGVAINDFTNKCAAEECSEPDCPVHGNEGGSILSELFKQFEEAALKGRRKEDRA